MLLLSCVAFFTTAASAKSARYSRHHVRHVERIAASAGPMFAGPSFAEPMSFERHRSHRRGRARAFAAEPYAGGATAFGGGLADAPQRWIDTNRTGRSNFAEPMSFERHRSHRRGHERIVAAEPYAGGAPAFGGVADEPRRWIDTNPSGQSSFAEPMPFERHRSHRRERSRVVAKPNTGGVPAFGGGGMVAEARRWIGGNPTGRSSLWCAAFMNFVLERSGYQGSGSNMARSFASYGHRLPGPQVGAIAVMSRGGRGGHVGVVSGIDQSGNPIIISGNHGHRVAEATYSRGRVYAYVMP
jgi:uncharacterized protein (TIGR02594 family)